MRTELSSPPPLKLSHCPSPPLHNSSFVRAGLPAYLSSASPQRVVLLVGRDGSVYVTHRRQGSRGRGGVAIRGQSPKLAPRFRVFLWPSKLRKNTHSAEKESGLELREREGEGKEKDGLSQMRFVCEVPSWQSSWLLPLDIMGPLIQGDALICCDYGHFTARSINRVIHHHHHLHHHQHHMMVWWCFPPLHSVKPKWPVLIYYWFIFNLFMSH